LKILVVDDHECIRQGVRSILSFRPDIEVCGEAVDGKEAIEKADQLQADLIILDVTMPVLSGLAAARAIRKILPETRILMFSAYDEKVLIEEAKKLGVH
jgi:two-component system, NarL family, nitrate/nitrite response regulator NarL